MKIVYINTPSTYDYERLYTYMLFHVLIGILLLNLKNCVEIPIAKSQNRLHRDTCMYMRTMNCFFTRIDEPAAARQVTGLAMGA